MSFHSKYYNLASKQEKCEEKKHIPRGGIRRHNIFYKNETRILFDTII